MYAAPWIGAEHSYAGWVPNVGSHLSFSLIGAHRSPEVARFTQRYLTRAARFACALQLRETDDFLTPKWFNRIFMPDVRQHWLLVGSTRRVETPVGIRHLSPIDKLDRLDCEESSREVETAFDEQGMLVGQIHVLPYQRDPVDRLIQSWTLQDLRHRLACRHALSDNELDAFARDIGREIKVHCRNASSLHFALVRTGELRIWYEPKDTHLLKQRDYFDVAEQAYFFVKDMVHQHVHHDPSSDQITPLTAVPAEPVKAREEDWRRETVWNLSRVVDTLNRHGKLKGLREALGILAFADAFQKTLLPYRRDPADESQFLPHDAVYLYDYAHIRDSIRVRIDQTAARRTQHAQMLVAAFAGSIAMMALLSSLISTYNGTVEGDKAHGSVLSIHLPVKVLMFLAEIPYIPLLISWLALYGFSWLFLSEERMGPPKIRGRKVFQAMRGIVNSVATRLHWSARSTHLVLLTFYVIILLLLSASAMMAIYLINPVLVHV
jgi:hypothetical protein